MSQTSYYAYVDKADTFTNENGIDIFLEFHCLPIKFDDDWPQMRRQQFRAGLTEGRVPAIFLDTQLSEFEKNFPGILPVEMESEWYSIVTNDDGLGTPVTFFPNDAADGPGTPLFINSIEILSEQVRGQLDSNTDIDDFKDSSENDIKNALNRNNGQIAEYISVYNVGQGNANAICNNMGMPLLYLDLGGGCYKNKITYSTTLRFCFTHNPSIVLSHWDTDHYENARRNSAYHAKTWIVPRQKFGPLHKKFFLQLSATPGAIVLIWPTTLARCSFHFGEVVVCNHPNPKKKNHCGLAMVASLNPANNSIRKVLLPADAAYTYIPGHGSFSCDGVIATHHGAEFDTFNAPVPVPLGKSAIAYSFGKGNTYNHPRKAATMAHRHAKRLDSPKGNVAFCDSGPCPQSCLGANCDLAIAQHF